MNSDHSADNLVIVRAFVDEAATSACMTALDGDGGTWEVGSTSELREATILWPNGSITERAEIRREVVALYDAAAAKLGVPPRDHE